MNNPSLVIVLLEDKLHERLVHRYLIKRGFGVREIRILQAGSESLVRKRFAMEVAAYRSRSAKTALIVVIDADTGTVEQRLTQLDKELRKNKKPKIDANTDRVARLVPRRNVETWIKCLNGDAVDEKENYKKARRDWDELAHSAGEMLFEWTQSKTLPSHCVQSLRHGITELNRLRH